MMVFWKRASAALALWTTLAASAAAQQTGVVVGRVTDAGTQRPISDVQVMVAGTVASTRTGEDGRYRLTNAPAGAVTVRVVRLGYGAESRPLTVDAAATTTADFTLSPVAITLDQMVVTANGESERRRESGISIGAIDTSQLNPASVTSLSTVLAARTPGVSVVSSTGSTGMGSRIRIRGSNSINLSNDPLLIVDGVRVNNETASLAFSLAGQTTSRFDDLDPEDIETIEIIKGPAASALYGTAAASGVIQVTTKRGRAGKTRWNAFGEYGLLNDVTRYPDNWAQIGRLTVNPAVRVSRCVTENVVLGACTAVPDSMYRYQPLENPAATPFRQGFRNNYGMSAAGGADVATYYLSGIVEREQGVYDPNDLVRADIRANVRAQLAPNLDATVTTGYMSSRTGLTFNDNSAFGPIGAGLLGKPYDCSPSTWRTIPGCLATGDSSSRGYFNANTPATALWAQQMESNVDHFTSGLNTNWQPLPWLRGLGEAGIDVVQQNDTRFVPPNVLPQLGSTFAQGFKYAQRRTAPTYTLQGTATATFHPREGLESSTSFSGQYVREEMHWISAYGQQILPGTESLSGASSLFSVGESNQQIITLGIFGQEKLAWRDRVFLTTSLRGDQGSTFGSDAGYIYYPAASLSWVASDEPFFPHLGWLNQLRLRGAYGQSGQRPGFRQAESFFAAAPIRMSGAEQTGITIGGTGNADLRAERSTEWEGGLESNLFGGRMGAELTYYDKTTTDAIVRQILAPSLGATADRFANLGRVKNSGIEARLNGDVFERGPAKVEASLSFSTNHNKLLALGADTLPIIFGPQQYHTGYPLGAFFARRIVSYKDINGDGIISRVNCPAYGGVANPKMPGGPACEVVLSDSEQYLGSPLPTREAAFTPTLTLYQNVRISALFDYRGGFRQYNYTREFRCNGVGNCREMNDRTAPLADQANAAASRMGSSAGYIEDASFVKLRELALTFSASPDLASRMRVGGLSVTFAGRNLHTWTRYSGFDPEVNSVTTGTYGSFTQVDYLAQPPVRTLVTRVNVNF